VPIRRRSRQVEAIFDEEDSDVEAASPSGPASPPKSKPDESPSPPQGKVLRSTTRRKSSIKRTRESILRILNDQKSSGKTESSRHNLVDTILSPVDWLMGPVDETPTNENIREAWEHKQELVHRDPPWYIILPDSKFRLGWDFAMAWLLSMMAFYIPFRVSLFQRYFEHFSYQLQPNSYRFASIGRKKRKRDLFSSLSLRLMRFLGQTSF